MLADKAALLVLDNCEHLIDASARLAEHLLEQCPELRVLATSREPLGIIGEVVLAVPPLGQPAPDASAALALEYPAVRLFADRAAAARPDFAVDDTTVATVIEIVRRLDGLPLAIELAAARLRTLPLADIAARLSDRFRLLTGGSRTALPRHRTLRAVVEWSWDLLTEPERVLAERLAIFPAGVIERERERGVRRRHRAGRRTSPTCSPRSSTSRCCSASATGAACGCSRRSASTASSGWPSAASWPRCGAGTPTTSPRCSTRPSRT